MTTEANDQVLLRDVEAVKNNKLNVVELKPKKESDQDNTQYNVSSSDDESDDADSRPDSGTSAASQSSVDAPSAQEMYEADQWNLGGAPQLTLIDPKAPMTLMKYINEIWGNTQNYTNPNAAMPELFKKFNLNHLVVPSAKVFNTYDVIEALCTKFVHEPHVNSDDDLMAENREILRKFMQEYLLDPENYIDEDNQSGVAANKEIVVDFNGDVPHPSLKKPEEYDMKNMVKCLDNDLVEDLLNSRYGDHQIVDFTQKDDKGLYTHLIYNKSVDYDDITDFLAAFEGKIARNPHNFQVIHVYSLMMNKKYPDKFPQINLYRAFWVQDMIDTSENDSYILKYTDLKDYEQFLFYTVLALYENKLDLENSKDALQQYMEKLHLINDRLIERLTAVKSKSKYSQDLLEGTNNLYNENGDKLDVHDVFYVHTKKFNDLMNAKGKIRRYTMEYAITNNDTKGKKSLLEVLPPQHNIGSAPQLPDEDFKWKIRLNNNKIVLMYYFAKFGMNPYKHFDEFTKVPSLLAGDNWLTYRMFRTKKEFKKALEENIIKVNKGLKRGTDGDFKGANGKPVSKNAGLLRLYCYMVGINYSNFAAENFSKLFQKGKEDIVDNVH